MKSPKSTILSLAALAPALASAAQKPNIIFILCDDMGWGDLGCYGQQHIRTPHIDDLARQGMQFMQAYAGSPVSAPSRASLMTGQHSGHCAVRGNKEYWSYQQTVMYGENKDFARVGQHPLDTAHVVIPEIMKDMGYRTAQFGKWAGGYEGSESTPDLRGVDEFFGYICQFQ
ncbi:MAG: sulfatase-like hydrolase/transferase, partial [Prevotellaceae bacterium]|nr:sulfatase-like hydrolase/transferase [Prevotellaceae bacterium]